MKILNHNNKEIPVLHFQGNSRHSYYNLIKDLKNRSVKLPKNVGIITFCDQKNLTEAPLIYQLEKNEIKYENHAIDVKEWKNTLKASLTLKAIDKINAEYVLVLDSLDVVLTHNITEIIDRFKVYDKAVLFGATKNNFPNQIIDKIAMRDWFGQFKYLNAGTCIGEKVKVREFYTMCSDLACKIDNPMNNEQLVVRTVFDSCQDWVGLDYKCECFQTFSRVTIGLSNDKNARIVM